MEHIDFGFSPFTDIEIRINAAFPSFATRLAEVAPHLTPQERRVAMLVRFSLTTAEIARVFSVTEHAIEKLRSNTRQKLGLPGGRSLTTHLSSLG